MNIGKLIIVSFMKFPDSQNDILMVSDIFKYADLITENSSCEHFVIHYV